MKKLYMVKIFLLMLLIGFPIDNVFSQYVSTETGGEFNVGSSWVGDVVPTETWREITISQNSKITHNGSFSWGEKVTINGDFAVTGNFTAGYGGVDVFGKLKVDGVFTGSKIAIGDNATVSVIGAFDGAGGVTIGKNAIIDVHSFKGAGGVTIGADASLKVNGAFDAAGGLEVGDKAKVDVIGNFNMGGGTTANIKGNLYIEGNLVASGNEFIIHDGVTVTVNGNVDAKVPIEVKDGGTLIVNGNYKNSQSLTINEGGFVSVDGEYNSKGALSNSGVLLVTGNYINNSGGNGISVLGKGLLDIGGDLVANKAVNVESEAVLIVRGSLNYEGGQSGVVIKGTLIVKEDFNIKNGEISSTGKVVVGGTFKFNGGGFTSPEGNKNLYLLDSNAPHSYIKGGKDLRKSNTGDADDFIANEGDDLKDLVDSVMPDTVSPKYKWVGSQNSVWTNVENWNGSLPRSKSSVIIENKGHNPEILSGDGLVELKSLTINSNAVLTLKPGAKLTVNGGLDIMQEGGLVLKNTYTPNGLASLITHGSVTGEVKVNLTLPNNQWYYLASPMKDVDYSHFGALQENSKIYAYRKQWVQYSYSNPSSAPELQPLEGTLTMLNQALPNDETTIEYSGVINNEAVARKLTSKGYYLFGNPYPSFINWQDTNWERDRIYGTIWYRTRVNQEMGFITYNKDAPEYARAAMFPDNVDYGNEEELALIPPYQSVWVYSKTASLENSVTLSVTPKQRAHGLEGGMLKSSSGRARADVIRVVSQNGSSRDGAVIYFSEEATPNFDPGDSQKYFNSSVAIPEVYTRGAGQMLAINGLPPLEGEMDLPLSVRNRVEGSVFLKFDLSKFNDEDVVLLRDEYLDVEINLRKVKQYNYEPIGLGDDHDRFVLRFNPAGYEDVSTNIFDEKVEQESSQINIVGINGRAIVSISRELLAMGTGKIEVYSIGGIKLAETEARTNKTFLVLPEEKGVYIVVVSASGERKVKKLLR